MNQHLQPHPLSLAFPAMSADDFADLLDSVKNIGVQEPITLYNGMIIDGRHRHQAACQIGVDCPAVELGDVDPRAFVVAKNKSRRHLTAGQRALAVAQVYEWKPVGTNQHSGGPATMADPQVKTTRELAAIADVGARTMERAKAVEAKATNQVKDAVKAGTMSIEVAAQVAQPAAPKKRARVVNVVQAVDAANHQTEISGLHADLAEAGGTITTLAEEVEDLRAKLAVEQMDASEEAKTAAADLIAELRGQVKSLEAELSATRVSRDAYQSEVHELKKQISMNQRDLAKARAA